MKRTEYILDAQVVTPEPEEQVTVTMSLHAAGVLLSMSGQFGGVPAGPRGVMDQLYGALRMVRVANGTRLQQVPVKFVDGNSQDQRIVAVYLQPAEKD